MSGVRASQRPFLKKRADKGSFLLQQKSLKSLNTVSSTPTNRETRHVEGKRSRPSRRITLKTAAPAPPDRFFGGAYFVNLKPFVTLNFLLERKSEITVGWGFHSNFPFVAACCVQTKPFVSDVSCELTHSLSEISRKKKPCVMAKT